MKMNSKPARYPLGEEKSKTILMEIIPVVREAIRDEEDPSVSEIARRTRSPFRVLISTVISARTKDEVTRVTSDRLFLEADSPEAMVSLDEEKIAELIYPAGFYKNKARSIRRLSQEIIKDYGGKVPDTIEDLLSLPGVGRKTANLVVTRGFGKEGICVDTHVHRICNRLGVIDTPSPDKTEFALRKVLPREFWIEINDLLVKFGKKICTPQSPHCSICPIKESCECVGVERWR
jgi:endonuclease-3